MGTIIPREKGNNTYYVYQETYREKIGYIRNSQVVKSLQTQRHKRFVSNS